MQLVTRKKQGTLRAPDVWSNAVLGLHILHFFPDCAHLMVLSKIHK